MKREREKNKEWHWIMTLVHVNFGALAWTITFYSNSWIITLSFLFVLLLVGLYLDTKVYPRHWFW